MSRNKTQPESRSATGLVAGVANGQRTHTTGVGCLYVKRLSDINLNVLERMVKTAFSARHNVSDNGLAGFRPS
jgi:hypothetical protein